MFKSAAHDCRTIKRGSLDIPSVLRIYTENINNKSSDKSIENKEYAKPRKLESKSPYPVFKPLNISNDARSRSKAYTPLTPIINLKETKKFGLLQHNKFQNWCDTHLKPEVKLKGDLKNSRKK